MLRRKGFAIGEPSMIRALEGTISAKGRREPTWAGKAQLDRSAV
jgi:hypothetical protein